VDATLDEMPRLIQAGMGVRVSSCTLANTTSRLGALGVVSAVGLRHIVIEEIRQGREDVIAVAKTFPLGSYVDAIMQFAPGGAKHRRPAPLDDPDPVRGDLPKRLSVIAAYVEVIRAKQGHRGKVGNNVMWKCALTVLPSIYGAMLAGVDSLLCGAGVPMELPDIVRRIRAGQDLEYKPLHGTGTNATLTIAQDDPAALFAETELPKMMPILSNFAFPRRIVDIWAREMDGARPFAFILENHEAGGHNAPPRNKSEFGELDDIDSYFDRVHALGVPIYVAGAFPSGGSRSDLLYWMSRGAYGVQVGSRFALCDESGMRRDLKDAVIEQNARGEEHLVTHARVSPTGYPFKYREIPGTLSDPAVHAERKRLCNKGYLLQGHYEDRPDGTIRETYICPAMPEKQYRRLGGTDEEMDDRVCLCNTLLAAVGLAPVDEPPLVTLGQSGSLCTERRTAREVIEDILTPEYVAAAEAALTSP
jgi:NAD(P)H-dependent flavin oxidoreductase YrpB (nitropropane dioxygenase family)